MRPEPHAKGGHAVGWILQGIGSALARYLEKPVQGYEPFTPSDADALRASLQPGDVLLIEGNSHVSGVIKYLTQSTWSHAVLYVGPIDGGGAPDGEPHVLIEANVGEGVVSAPLSKYLQFHTRICRPVGLTGPDCLAVCAHAVERIGLAYDLKNIIDLMRYLFPLPVPQRWRRRLMALGSGDPSRLICSALIAEAFRTVQYPILPKIRLTRSRQAIEQILEIRPDVPVILHTDYPEEASVRKARAIGVRAIIGKSSNMSQLITYIRRLVQS